MSLRRLAAAARRSLEQDAARDVPGDVVSAVLAVEVEGRRELVAASLVDGELRLACADPTPEPFLAAARVALAELDGGGGASAPSPSTSSPGVVSIAPDPVDDVPPRARALTELLTAVVRLGVERASGAPAVVEAIDRLAQECGSAPGVGVARFIGRLRHALAERDVTTTARLLHGAARLARDLSDDSKGARERAQAFLGSPVEVSMESVVDRCFFELGRERVSGLERHAISRRYLLDLGDGQIYVEATRGSNSPSLGPSPRLVTAGLAEVQRGPLPPTVRLLQYAVSGAIEERTFDVLTSFAVRRFADLVEGYRVALKQSPALAEPFALIAPQRFRDEGMTAVDVDGGRLPLVRTHALGRSLALAAKARAGQVRLVAGRLVDHDGVLRLVPLAALLEREDGRSYWRLS